MSLFESEDSNGQVSLKNLFDGETDVESKNNLSLGNIAFLTSRGSWPTALDKPEHVALDRAFDYYNAIVKVDISHVDGIKREPECSKLLMRFYARNQGTSVFLGVLRADIASNDEGNLSENTVLSYLNALKQIFVIEDLAAWNPNLRLRTAVRKTDTRFFQILPSLRHPSAWTRMI